MFVFVSEMSDFEKYIHSMSPFFFMFYNIILYWKTKKSLFSSQSKRSHKEIYEFEIYKKLKVDLRWFS